jgi:hypothetical protein
MDMICWINLHLSELNTFNKTNKLINNCFLKITITLSIWYCLVCMRRGGEVVVDWENRERLKKEKFTVLF